MKVSLAPITTDELSLLRNLWQLYVHDFSDFVSTQLRDDGRFESDEEFAQLIAPPLTLHWIRADGQIAGFVFIRPHSHLTGDPTVSDVAQFFVLRSYRNHGIGKAAAVLTFASCAGQWEVREMRSNVAAQAFWRSAIAMVTNGDYEEHVDDRWVVQRFRTT